MIAGNLVVVCCVASVVFTSQPVHAQECYRRPATMPPTSMWGPLQPLTSGVPHDYTSYEGVGVPPPWFQGMGVTGIEKTPLVFWAGTYFALVTLRDDNTLPSERNMKPKRSVYTDFCINAQRGESDVFIGNVAVDPLLNLLCVSTPNPSLAMTCWTTHGAAHDKGPKNIYRVEGVGHKVAMGGGFVFHATKEFGVGVFDAGMILDCDLSCGSPSTCTGTQLGRLPMSGSKPLSVAAKLHDSRVYVAVTNGADVELFIHDRGVFVRVGVQRNSKAWDVELFDEGRSLYLAMRSTDKVQIWEVNDCEKVGTCNMSTVWRLDERNSGKPRLSTSGRMLYAYDKSPYCYAESLNALVSTRGEPRDWYRLDVSGFVGHLNTFSQAESGSVAILEIDDETFMYVPNHSSLVALQVDVGELIFYDGWETGDVGEWDKAVGDV